MKLKLDPIKQFTLFLAVMTGLTIGFNPSAQLLLHLAATLGFGLILYWFYSNFSSKHKLVWNTMITALIIFLVVDPGVTWVDALYPLIATFVAISIKFFWEYRKSPVVNPSVAGMLIMAGIVALIPMLDNGLISWWGASFNAPVSLIVVLAWVFLGLHRWRKWPAVLAFLVAHALVLVLRGMETETLRFIFTDSTVYFLAAVMLIDPKTSPLGNRDQVVFGILAALVYNSLLHGGAPHAELFAIAAANIGWMAMRPTKKLKKKKV